VTTLAEACADLRPLLPVARALLAAPDAQGSAGHAQPASAPPWNQAAANAVMDIHAAVREIEREFRAQVTGRLAERGGSEANTRAALDAICRFAGSVTDGAAADAAIVLARLADAVLMLPAVDLEERPRRLPGICPQCDRCMIRTWLRDGNVACLGCGLRGFMRHGTVSDGCIEWEDGAIT
jgi:hypothetical protein